MGEEHKKSHTSWVFTINNYTEDDLDRLEAIKPLATTLFASKERGAQNGTPHIQGFVTFKKPKRHTGLSKLLPRAWLKPAAGGKVSNRRYIIEGINTDGTPKEHSEPFIEQDAGPRGTRSDLSALLETGRTRGIKRAAEEHPEAYAKYHRGLKAYLSAISRGRTEPPAVYWLHGPTGIGKTRFAYDRVEDPEMVLNAINAPKWWDGLDPFIHSWVVLDEFDKHEYDRRQLLMVLDRYALRTQTKGDTVNFNVPNIVITSSIHPNLIFPPDVYSQVRRRLTNIGYKESLEDDWLWEEFNPEFQPPIEYNNDEEESSE